MIATSDFSKGSTKILWKDEPWVVLDYQLVQPGKGGTYLRTKIKNLITGRILEETFRSSEKFYEPNLEKFKAQYLYSSDAMYHFFDQESFEQLDFNEEQVESVKGYLKEQEIYTVLLFRGKPISIEPPIFLVLEIAQTVPGVKGDTAQGGSKHATLETGLVITVPLFVNEGDNVKVDTRQGKYIERVDT